MSINRIKFRPLSWLKNLILSNKTGRQPYLIHFGLYNGLLLNLDLNIQAQIYFGLWERETYRYIRKAAKNVQWVIDIGSGSGELCLYFLRNSNVDKIIAIDPQASENNIFQLNLVLNGEQNCQRITILQKFVGTSPDAKYISIDDLDIIKGKHGFIKIDVEGAELDVLKSGQYLITRAYPDILIETHTKKLEDVCIEWLQDKGYQCKVLKNAWWRFMLPEYRSIAHNRWLWAIKKGD